MKLQKQFIDWGPNNCFYRWKNLKSSKSKNKTSSKKNYLSELVLKLLILFVFIMTVWLISALWCLKNYLFQTQMVVHKCTLIYSIYITRRLLSTIRGSVMNEASLSMFWNTRMFIMTTNKVRLKKNNDTVWYWGWRHGARHN